MAYSVKSNCSFDSEKYRKNTVTHVVITLTLLYYRYLYKIYYRKLCWEQWRTGYGGDVAI